VETWARGRIAVRAWQTVPEQMARLGLSADDGMRQVWFVESDGTLCGGAEAVNRAVRRIWWARPLAWLWFLPGMPALQGRIYRWVAANRHRLPGSTPACGVPRREQ
jgi:predicted DCC family thiol-disulfide oxidoreductase YuxK